MQILGPVVSGSHHGFDQVPVSHHYVFCEKDFIEKSAKKTTTIYIIYKKPTTTKTYKHYTEYKRYNEVLNR